MGRAIILVGKGVGGEAGGNVVGPASSTNNALVRWDGTTGKLVKDSNVTLADSGTALVFSGAGGITASGSNSSITLTPSGTGKLEAQFQTNKFIADDAAAGVPALFLLATATTPSGTNYTIAGDGTNTYNNAPLSTGSIRFNLGGTEKARFALTTGNLLLGGLTTDGGGNQVLQIPGTNVVNWGATALASIGVSADTTAGVLTLTAPSSGSINLTKKVSSYNGISTAGWGVEVVQADGAIAGTTNSRSAAVATYTVGAADGTFVVSGNLNITSGSAFSFSLDCVYTDEGNTSRTLVLPLAQLAGTFVATGLATNVTGTGPYESASMTIRCKASTSITIRPSSGGTYTTVVYDTYANIRQVG